MKTIVAALTAFILCCLLIVAGCQKDPIITEDPGEEYSGGAATVFNISPDAFGQQVPGLSSDDELRFFVGNSFFKQNWVTAPSSTTARDGLGPLFHARSCSACHFKDGRGSPESTGSESNGLLFRLAMGGAGTHGEPVGDPVYGDQLQDNAIMGVNYEGKVDITYDEITGTYPDGTAYSLRKPTYTVTNLQYGSLAASQISPRIAQQIIGMGLLEAIPENTIMSFADENDANGDGISGKANYVWNAQSQTTTMGRFGWKANQPSVFQQTCGAFLGDMGITTSLFSTENCGAIPNCQSLANGGSPEIIPDDLDKVVLYTATQAVPARRNWNDKDVLAGKLLFTNLGCAKCHTPTIQTGNYQIAPLANQTIHPYTDLLLHDMGNELSDNRPDFLANGNEWRTQPLWGLGLIETVNNHTFLLHDGRARNIEEAILWHGGEAEKAKNNFKNLSKQERDKLLLFLNSL